MLCRGLSRNLTWTILWSMWKGNGEQWGCRGLLQKAQLVATSPLEEVPLGEVPFYKCVLSTEYLLFFFFNSF